MASFTEPFTRADGAIGANWSQNTGTWTVASNTGRQTASGSQYYLARYTATAPASANYEIEANVRISSVSGARGVGVAARVTTGSVAYILAIFETVYLIRVITATSEAVLDSGGTVAANTTYNLRLVVNGTTLTGYLDDVEVVSATDSNITDAGHWGLVSYGQVSGTNDYYDDVAGADLAGSSPIGPLIGGKLATHSILQGRLVR